MTPCPRCGHENVDHARFCSACGAILEARASVDDPLIGRIVADRYRIVRPIGEGGMGRVYLAEQRMGTTTRAVAIKVLTTPMSDSLAVARFYRECETVVQLTHPHTIRFYDFGELALPLSSGAVDRRLYIAMEYVDGRSLATAIESGPLPLDIVDRLVRQIGGALTEAHRRGIVHRDLKPDNVLLAHNEAEGEIAKVLDFGIAKKDHVEGPEITAQGTIIGTPAYMSPEQISGMRVDERSDVYALALMTYEMLTGARPFAARTPIEWATAHMMSAPRSFDEFPSAQALSPERRAAILRGLEKDPQSRTASVRRFVDDFCGIESSQPTPIPRIPSTAPPSDLGNAPTLAAPHTPRDTAPHVGAIPGAGPGLGAILGAALGGIALIAAGAATVWVVAGGPSDVQDVADAAAPHDAGTDAEGHLPHEWLTILHFEERARDATHALGPPDGRCASIAPGGTITLELTPGARMLTDGTEHPDLQIEVREGSGPYRVDVGVERRQFRTIAQGLVTSSPLDVDQFGIPRFRYVKIKNRATRGDVCVDAVAAHRHE
ncbi:serine/threonine-protein kinase [Sandaracinus amylolyticus]|nr:serine/threonine-protein kinase [Sandaracinus amylolyticus]